MTIEIDNEQINIDDVIKLENQCSVSTIKLANDVYINAFKASNDNEYKWSHLKAITAVMLYGYMCGKREERARHAQNKAVQSSK